MTKELEANADIKRAAPLYIKRYTAAQPQRINELAAAAQIEFH